MIQLFWEKNWHIKVFKNSTEILIHPKLFRSCVFSQDKWKAWIHKNFEYECTVYLFLGDIISCLEKIQEKYKTFSYILTQIPEMLSF